MPATIRVLIRLTLFGLSFFNFSVWAVDELGIEIFTSGRRPIAGADEERFRTATVTIYAIDSLYGFESRLSEGLSANPETAMTEALHRIQRLDDAAVSPAKNAAIGLAKAVQYGIDRHPAVVFDGHAVVYGVTDLVEALDRFEAWQRERMP